MGGKIRASMTVIIEKDKTLQMYLNYEFIMILRRKKKHWSPLEDDRKPNYYFENGK